MKFSLLKSNFLGRKLNYLRISFIIIWTVLIIIVLFIPHIIRDDVYITNTFLFEEEMMESVFIVCLLIIGLITIKIYQKELKQREQKIQIAHQQQRTTEERLNDAFSYIGSLNVQIQEIHSALTTITKYPEHKKDFKKIMVFLSEKALGVVKVPWALIRIITTENYHTLTEYQAFRGGQEVPLPLISNKNLMNKEAVPDYSWISSDTENLFLRAFCVMPAITLSDNQQILIKTILKQLEMLYLVYSSQYYQEGNKQLNTFQKTNELLPKSLRSDEKNP